MKVKDVNALKYADPKYQFEKAKKGGPAKTTEQIVDNIMPK
jgi:hypothetical protein